MRVLLLAASPRARARAFRWMIGALWRSCVRGRAHACVRERSRGWRRPPRDRREIAADLGPQPPSSSLGALLGGGAPEARPHRAACPGIRLHLQGRTGEERGFGRGALLPPRGALLPPPPRHRRGNRRSRQTIRFETARMQPAPRVCPPRPPTGAGAPCGRGVCRRRRVATARGKHAAVTLSCEQAGGRACAHPWAGADALACTGRRCARARFARALGDGHGLRDGISGVLLDPPPPPPLLHWPRFCTTLSESNRPSWMGCTSALV